MCIMEDMSLSIVETAVSVSIEEMRKQNSPQAQICGCVAFIEMSIEHSDVLVRKGAVECLLEAMESFQRQPSVIASACEALLSILHGSRESILNEAVKGKCAEFLGLIIRKNERCVGIQSLIDLFLSITEEYIEHSLERRSYLVKTLSHVMRSAREETVSKCALALDHIFQQKEKKLLRDVVDNEATCGILCAMQAFKSDLNIQEKCVRALLEMAFTFHGPIDVCEEVVFVVVSAMGGNSSHPNLQYYGCMLLAELAACEFPSKTCLISEGSISQICASIWKFPNYPEVLFQACKALTMYARFLPELISADQMVRILPSLLSLLFRKATDSFVVEYVLRTLSTLVEAFFEKNDGLLLSKESISKINDIACSMVNNVTVFKNACELFWVVAANEDDLVKKVLIDAKVPETIIKGLRVHSNDESIQLRGAGVLWNLVKSDDYLSFYPQPHLDCFDSDVDEMYDREVYRKVDFIGTNKSKGLEYQGPEDEDKGEDICGSSEYEEITDSDERFDFIVDILSHSQFVGCILTAMEENEQDKEAQLRACRLLETVISVIGDGELQNGFEFIALERLKVAQETHSFFTSVTKATSRLMDSLERRIKHDPLKMLLGSLWSAPAGSRIEVNACESFADCLQMGYSIGEKVRRFIIDLMLQKIKRLGSTSTLQYQACRVLLAMSGSAHQVVDLLFGLGAHEVILDLLRQHPKDPKIQHIACDLMGDICFLRYAKAHFKERQAEILVLRAIRHHSTDKQVFASAVFALYCLCEDDRAYANLLSLMMRENYFEVILEGVRRFPSVPQLQNCAWVLFGFLTNTYKGVNKILWRLGVAKDLHISMVTHKDSPQTQLDGCKIVTSFAGLGGGCKTKLIEMGFGESIVYALRKNPHDEGVQFNGIRAVSAIATGSDDSIKLKLLQLGVADFIFLAIFRLKDSKAIRTAASAALASLVPSKLADGDCGDDKVARFRTKTPEVLLDLSRKSRDDCETLSKARDGLLKLFESKEKNVLVAAVETCTILLTAKNSTHFYGETLKTLEILQNILPKVDPGIATDLLKVIWTSMADTRKRFVTDTPVISLTYTIGAMAQSRLTAR